MIECDMKVCLNNDGKGNCGLDDIHIEVQKLNDKNIPVCSDYNVSESDLYNK